jgi:uncharacterized membrane protein
VTTRTSIEVEVRAAGLEGSVARVLRLGTYAAVGLIAAGVILMLVAGQSPLDAAPPLNPWALPADLLAGRPAGLLWLGLLVMLATPATRVAVSCFGFSRAGDRAMAGIAALVLVVIATGVILGTAAG